MFRPGRLGRANQIEDVSPPQLGVTTACSIEYAARGFMNELSYAIADWQNCTGFSGSLVFEPRRPEPLRNVYQPFILQSLGPLEDRFRDVERAERGGEPNLVVRSVADHATRERRTGSSPH